jgi:hypothetical protein
MPSNGSQRITDLESASVLNDADQFLFFQNSTKTTKRITKGDMASTGGGLRGVFIDSRTGDDVGLSAAAASITAGLAQVSANGAQASANGKNEVYYQTSQPVVTSFTGSISGTELTVAAATPGSVIIGRPITNASIQDGTVITAFIAGSGTSGGTGRYTVSVSQTVNSSTIYCGYNPGDIWFDTDDNYRLTVYQNTGTWQNSFAPLLRFVPGTTRVTGLVKADGSEADFVLLADKFQIWNGISAEVPFYLDSNVVYINEAKIRFLDAGKLTAGFIGAQVISINGDSPYSTQIAGGGFLESSTYVLTWPGVNVVNIKKYEAAQQYLGKVLASDVVQVKLMQSDGSYKLYRALLNQPKNATQFAPPNATYWQEVPDASVPETIIPINSTENATVKNFGFRIAQNGYAEFAGGLFRGAVVANEGYFGNKSDAVRIDAAGLSIGGNGRIKSSTLTWNENSTDPTSGTGFFLGFRNNQYQFFIGNHSTNNLRWNGTNLFINGELIASSSAGGGSAGLTISSGYGIRYKDKVSTLTITGGDQNGVQAGAQIDFVGVDSAGPAGDANGQLILQAGYKKHPNTNAEATGFTDTWDGSMVFRTGYGSSQNNLGAVLIGRRRLIIHRDGTVRVGSQGDTSQTGAPDGGSGVLVVETSVSAPTYTTTSSKRFKKKIKNFKNGLETVCKLRPVTFDWKNKDLKNDIGLIAEEVNEILPNFVGLDGEGQIVGIDYGKLGPVLIQAVKELSVEIQRLKKKMKNANSN